MVLKLMLNFVSIHWTSGKMVIDKLFDQYHLTQAIKWMHFPPPPYVIVEIN